MRWSQYTTIAILLVVAILQIVQSTFVFNNDINLMKIAGKEGSPNELSILSTTATHRVILFQQGKFCSEPPPEALANVSAELGSTTRLSGLPLQSSQSNSAKQIFNDSKGVTYLRNSMFFVCQSWLNGQISDEMYSKTMIDILHQSANLIMLETEVEIRKAEIQKLNSVTPSKGMERDAPDVAPVMQRR